MNNDYNTQKNTQRKVLITGANRGLGLEFVKQYARKGYRVLAVVRNLEKSLQLKAFKLQYPSIYLLSVDMSDMLSIKRIVQHLSGVYIDVLINNAGYYVIDDGVSDWSEQDWIYSLKVNAMGPLALTQGLMPNVLNSKEKTVLFIGSQGGAIADNTSGGIIMYRSSKSALEHVCRNLYHKYAKDGLYTYVICPGWVRTDMGGSAAPLSPQESVEGIIRVVEQAKEKGENGIFLNYKGRKIPW